MVNVKDILETINMIREENLDIRTTTMGISLYDCACDDDDRFAEKIYDKFSEAGRDMKNVHVVPCVSDAVEKAKEISASVSDNPLIYIGGSTYVVSEAVATL